MYTEPRERVILIGADREDAKEAERLLKLRWEPIHTDNSYTVQISSREFEGVRLRRVYVTGRATEEMPDELRDVLTRTMAKTKDREGFFLILENGDLHGPEHAHRPEAV